MKKRTLQILALIFAVILAASCLAACNGDIPDITITDNDNNEKPTPEDSKEPITPSDCSHDLIYFKGKEATCENGFSEYWACKKCSKLFSDNLGKNEITYADITLPGNNVHTPVTDSAVAPTYDTTGLTEGSHCSVCGYVITKQLAIPKLEIGYYSISYNNLKGAVSPALTSYAENTGVSAQDMPVIAVNGYTFKGWYTASEGGELVDYIEPGSKKNYTLFARWETITYTITYVDAPSHTNRTEYTVESDFALENPIWSGLAFSHWTDESGNTINAIHLGTVGNKTLTAHWTLLENISVPAGDNSETMVVYNENSERYHFIVPLGTINNVFLGNLCVGRYKYLNSALEWSVSETVGFEESIAEAVSRTVAHSVMTSTEWSNTVSWATTNSSSLTSSLSAEIGAEYAGISAKISASLSATNTSERTDTQTTVNGGGTEEGTENSQTTSSTVSYNNVVTSTITVNQTISPEMPEGTYTLAYVGKVYVYAIITYDNTDKNYYLDIYSYMDDTITEMPLYTPPAHSTADIKNAGTLACKVDTAKLDNYVASAYYVSYDANGGEGDMPVTMIQEGAEQALYPNAFSKVGYKFEGWKLSADDTTSLYQDTASVLNLAAKGETVTLYAHWTSINYTVTYDANGGVGTMEPSSHTYDQEAKLIANNFSMIGYSFAGWTLEKDSNEVIYTDNADVINLSHIADDAITLYAVWQINTYSVTFVTNDSNVIVESQYYTYGSLTEAPAKPERLGYVFVNWSFDDENFAFGNEMPAHDITATANWTYSSFRYDSGYSKKKIDASHEYDYDSFDISVLSPFMTEEYTLRFNVELLMYEENEGYQEIYLINSNEACIASNSEFAYGGGGTDSKEGWVYFTFDVNGNNCTNGTTIRYGAHGEWSDDWYRCQAIVTVTVIKK